MRARITTRFAELHADREHAEARLAALAAVTPKSVDPALLEELPLAGDIVLGLPADLRARLLDAFDLQVLWNKPGGQATVSAELTDATLQTQLSVTLGVNTRVAVREFTKLAQEYLDDRAERHPSTATDLGDHRFDARLGDPSEQARADERRALDGWAARLEAIDDSALSAEHRVDAAMMADGVARRVFELDELREHTWNPLQANPGKAIYQLLARDFAPLPDRLAAVAGRLADVPAVLEALTEHRAWLSARLEEAARSGEFADPRVGAERFGHKLSLTLNAAADADAILARAEADLSHLHRGLAGPGRLAA